MNVQTGTQSLSELPVGTIATVTAICEAAAPHVARRLIDLGLTISTEVTWCERPTAGPAIYHFRDTSFWLRKGW
jgi:ferrous iron transport protein A